MSACDRIISITIAKTEVKCRIRLQNMAKRYTNRCVLHHCRFLVSNKSQKDIPHVRVSGHKSEASIKSYARKLSSSTKHAISDTFSIATEVLAANNASIPKKTTKQPRCLSKSIFTQTRLKQRAAISSHFSFAIVNDPWKIILK